MRTRYPMFNETRTRKFVTVSLGKDCRRQDYNQTSHTMIVCLLQTMFHDMYFTNMK